MTVANVATWADGMSGIFWLFLNKGRYTESKRKVFLTGVNLIIFAIGACLVCLSLLVTPYSPILTAAVRTGPVCLGQVDPR